MVWSDHDRLMHLCGRGVKPRNSSQAPRIARIRRGRQVGCPASKGSKCRVQENLLGALADPDLVDVD